MIVRKLSLLVAITVSAGAIGSPSGASGSAGASAGASRPVAYCPLPAPHGAQAWGFHAGAPISAATGSYAHGRGTLSGQTAGGAICQVDRVAGAPDRQIILKIGHGAVVPQHAVTVNGQLGNRMRLRVRVASSTDSQCKVGAAGSVTLFATYNGVHHDTARFSFGATCRDHNHTYSGSSVVALVPR